MCNLKNCYAIAFLLQALLDESSLIFVVFLALFEALAAFQGAWQIFTILRRSSSLQFDWNTWKKKNIENHCVDTNNSCLIDNLPKEEGSKKRVWRFSKNEKKFVKLSRLPVIYMEPPLFSQFFQIFILLPKKHVDERPFGTNLQQWIVRYSGSSIGKARQGARARFHLILAMSSVSIRLALTTGKRQAWKW